MGNDVKNKSVSIYIDQAAAETALQKLQSKADSFNKKIDEARQKQTALRQEIEKLEPASKTVDGLQKNYDELSKSVAATSKKLIENKITQRELKDTASQLSERLENAANKQAVLVKEIKKNEEAGKSVVALQRSYEVTKKEIETVTEKLTANSAAMQVVKEEALALSHALAADKANLAGVTQQLKSAQLASTSLIKLNNDVKTLDKTIDGYDASLKKVDQQQRNISYSIDRGMGPSLVQQKALVEKLRREWEHLPSGTDEYISKTKELSVAKTRLHELETAIDNVGKAQKNWLNEAKGVAFGVAIGGFVQNALQAIPSYFKGLVTGNGKLSDSLADVSKATNLTDAQVIKLNSDLSRLDTRTKADQLRQIAIGLGQINEAATPENIAAIDKIVVALGDEFGTDANTITNQLSVLRNNLQDIKTSNYGEDVAHIGNALNVLGANGLATAPVVTDISNRIAGVGQQFGLTSGQILGTSATFQELGIETERGSTAIIKVFQKMAAEPEKFAKIAKAAGVATKEDFIKLLNTDMLGAFVKVAEGARIAGKDNSTFGKILKQLDTDGSGAGEVLSKLATNEKLLADKVKLASDALKNQDSITAEFNKKNTTLGAELDKLGKRFSSLFTNSALSNIFTGMARSLNEVIAPTKTATQEFDELSKKVQHLDKDILPLANRYDELKTKTSLSKDEQTEMKSIISQITAIMPGAVTQFDVYGNAIAISTTRVREFIGAEKARLQVVNRQAIEDNQKKLVETADKINQIGKLMKDIEKTGTFNISETSTSGVSGGGVTILRRKATQEEIAETEEKYKQLLSDRLGYNTEIKRLNGQALQENLDATKKTEEEIKKQNDVVVDLGDDKTGKKQLAALNSFKDFLDGVDKAILNNQIPAHAQKLISDLFKMQDELKKLEEYKKTVGLSDKQYADASAKILEEYHTSIQRFVEDETKNFKKVLIEDSTIAAKDLPANLRIAIQRLPKEKVDLPLTFNTAITPDEQKALKQKLDNLLANLQANTDASYQLDILNARNPKEAKDAKLNQLDYQNTDLLKDFEKQRAEIEKGSRDEIDAALLLKYREYLQNRSSIEEEYIYTQEQKVSKILGYLNEALDIYSQFVQVQNQNEQRALDRELKANDVKKAAYKKQLNQKLISEQEYQIQVNNLDKDAAQKKEALDKKQFERNKKIQIAQAIISGAQAINQIRMTVPPVIPGTPFPNPELPLFIAEAVASSLAEIAIIASTKFAEGGRVDHPGNGRITTPSNIATQPNGDDVLATVKRGEVILNEQQQAKLGGDETFRRIGVPGFATGGLVRPAYQTRAYQPVDYTGITKSFQMLKFFAAGGAVKDDATDQPAAPPQQLTTDPALLQLLLANMQVMQQLNTQLSKPITSEISLKKIDDARAQQNRILEQASLK